MTNTFDGEEWIRVVDHVALMEKEKEAEAYNWFNQWYNSHIAKQDEKMRFDFAQWATNRLQELGVSDEGSALTPTTPDKQIEV